MIGFIWVKFKVQGSRFKVKKIGLTQSSKVAKQRHKMWVRKAHWVGGRDARHTNFFIIYGWANGP
jgi:hypothetical protein